MAKLSDAAKKAGISAVLKYLDKNPEENLGKVMDLADTLAGSVFEHQRGLVRKAIVDDPDSNWRKLVLRVLNNTDPKQKKKVLSNFFINAVFDGWKRQDEYREKYNCNIPWAILLDPTSACNLHCTGCWAAEYGNKLNLTFDEIDDLIEQGKELGVYFYIYTGGEPLVRKDDIIKLCEKHQDCVFLSFTNGTLIDEAFADEMLRVSNFIPAISVEGDEAATDGRRGEGVYKRAHRAMDLLKERHLAFGISTCYTSANFESISSEEFFDQMIDWGAYFVWFFHYMPVGKDAVTDLLLTPEQRTEMFHRIRNIRSKKDIFIIDFQNDGEHAGGCIAGGRRYLHINANGDVDPCVFVHYSDSNIREKTLLEALRSPLFQAYHDGQPFNHNHLRPCPMLENPEKLRAIVHETGAKSTDMEAPEPVDVLCDRCAEYAACWKPVSEELWKIDHPDATFEE